jgi:uncharacterized protein YebE (UPF0316 family)
MNKISGLNFWDWKSIRRTFFVFIVLVLGITFVFFYPDWKRNIEAKKFSESTEAILIDVKSNETISMTEVGNQIIVHSYEVKFKYSVRDTQYESKDIIPNSIENKNLITRICINKNEKLKIKYDPKKTV